MTAPELSVIVISHGHADMLPGCIGSLAPIFSEVTAELIVIDNLPGREVAAALAETPATLVENPQPFGFAANVNKGVALSRGRHILLLNPDTVYDGGAIGDLLAFLQSRADVGLLSCTLLNADGTPQQNYRQFPTLAVLLARGLAADRWPWRPAFYRRRLMESAGSSAPFRVDWVFGAFMLMRRRDFDLIGGMDEGFRLYYEDVDLCRRLADAGLRTFMYPALRFIHLHGRESAKRPFSRQWRWHVSSALRYFRKTWFGPVRGGARDNRWETTAYGSGRQTHP